ncbi:MAG: phosphotyrosine protein phosphatase [Halothiobacillus sp. 14-56-357]|jgi:protein-tyrosine phosphatase|nr:MAG: phosphotyrosine protein phosphatase [Halothiobacillus sp. 14-56-357]OZB78018.1 MAG: phosphotyrosine protein phosphatase [Halothiobacillus sp. 13-55-115]
MSESEKVSVLFVCMGNICRSPTAEAVFRKYVEDADLMDAVVVDSAGTHAFHIGNPPDRRSTTVAAGRGYRMDVLRARQVSAGDIEYFDYVLAMDHENLSILRQLAPSHLRDKPRLFMSFAPDYGLSEVPDPYYGGPRGFDQVLDMVEAACDGLVQAIRQQSGGR